MRTRPLAAAHNNGLKVTIYDEEADHGGKAASAATVEGDLGYVLHRYAHEPAWLRVDGAPVVFIYERVLQEIPRPAWPTIIAQARATSPAGVALIADSTSAQDAKMFDGIHTYNIIWPIHDRTLSQVQHWAASTYPQWVKSAGSTHISCVTVIPGYDDRSQPHRPLPRPVVDRDNGNTYRVLWSQAIAAHPDWILITSWNEWHEGTEIEASQQFGDTALRTTAEYAHSFLAFSA